MRPLLVSLCLLAAAGGSMAQVSNQTADLSGPGYDVYNDGVPDLTTGLTYDGTGGAFADLAELCKNQGDRNRRIARDLLSMARNPKIPEALRRDALQAAKGLRVEGNQARGDAGFFSKAGKVLDALNVFNAFVKAAGYLAEGDKHGAMTVLVDEGVKKVTTTITTTVGSAIPVLGSTAGGIVGEMFHERYAGKRINEAENERFTKERMEKMLGPDLPRVQVLDWQGKGRTLEKNEYVDAGGNRKERTPEEQAVYEYKERKKSRETASSNDPLEKARRDLKAGRITDQEFERRRKEYYESQYEPEQGKVRGKGPRRGKDPDAPDTDELDEENEEIAPPKEGTEEGEEEPADELDEPEPPRGETPDILKYVKPMQVRASGSIQEDHSSGEFKNIVTTTVTLSFYNVGALAPGFEKAVLSYRAVSSLNGSESQLSCAGTFSGGPTGSFRLYCDKETVSIRLFGGAVARHGPFKLTVENPGAFANWP